MSAKVIAADVAVQNEPGAATNAAHTAAHLMAEYERTYGEPLDELKLHCLLCLAQRESYAVYDKPLFPEPLYGRPDGPYSPEAHEYFRQVQEVQYPAVAAAIHTGLSEQRRLVFAKLRTGDQRASC